MKNIKMEKNPKKFKVVYHLCDSARIYLKNDNKNG